MKIILASSSPRRLKLLTGHGYNPQVITPRVDESRIGDEDPAKYVTRLALAKAKSVKAEGALVIGADTVVVLNSEFLNKPLSRSDARQILMKLSGRTHRVYTGIGLVCPVCGLSSADYDSTAVYFNDLTEAAILEYIESGEPLDKAGAYGIQGMGSFLVKKIEGELDTVIGLPMKLFNKMIEVHQECLSKN
jgi:septum formation protein